MLLPMSVFPASRLMSFATARADCLREPTGLHERPTDLNHGDTDNSGVGEIKASLTLVPFPLDSDNLGVINCSD